MASSYPGYRYHSHAPAGATGARDNLAMLLAPLPALLPPPRTAVHPHHHPRHLHHLRPPSPTQSQSHRRGNCTMAMLLGDDAHAGDSRCRYPSKLCRNARVRKASGALHRYCAFHRNKANANQKRWVDRQRSETAASSPSSSGSSVSPPASPGAQACAKFRWILAAASSTQTPLSRESSSAAPRARDERETGGDDDHDKETEEEDGRASAATLGDDDWDALLSLLSPAAARRTTSDRRSGFQ